MYFGYLFYLYNNYSGIFSLLADGPNIDKFELVLMKLSIYKYIVIL